MGVENSSDEVECFFDNTHPVLPIVSSISPPFFPSLPSITVPNLLNRPILIPLPQLPILVVSLTGLLPYIVPITPSLPLPCPPNPLAQELFRIFSYPNHLILLLCNTLLRDGTNIVPQLGNVLRLTIILILQDPHLPLILLHLIEIELFCRSTLSQLSP